MSSTAPMLLQLETPRLVIRSFCDSDLEPLLAYRNDPEVYRYQGWEVPYSRSKALQFIENLKTVLPGTPGEWMQLALVRRSDGVMIGDVAFHPTRSNPRMAYLGYTLARSAWGQGYAREAAERTLDYLFKELNMHRVVADCDAENAASIRLLERLGFRREAHYIESYWVAEKSAWGSEYLYAMLEREWILR